MSTGFLRCSHCRGFYEEGLSACRYCDKYVPMKEAGAAKVFPDRATCRALQIAEFEQLPEEAHEDHMRPDPELLDKLCYCLHCGERGGTFEAIEMRWMTTEHMWACPCTTCGGRGFLIDIHLAERLWQCAQCQLWYAPADGDYRGSRVNCPKCGCKVASGWFDDEEDEEEELEKEEQLVQEGKEILSEFEPVEKSEPEDLVPYEDAVPYEDEDDGEDFFPGSPAEMERMPDDIDFPRHRPKPEKPKPGEFDDIPW